MPSLNPLEGDLFSPTSTLGTIEESQNWALEKTARLHDEEPVYPKKTYWALLPPNVAPNVAGVEMEKYHPSGLIQKETAYNPLLMFASLFNPTILRKVGEHEGIHAGTPGKKLLSHVYYDISDKEIKLGYVEPESVPKSKYLVGEAIIEGGVKLISKKIGGVEQKSYPISSKMAEEIDRKLTEIDDKYSLVYIQKLAGDIEKKLIKKYFPKFDSNPGTLTMEEVPKELYDLLSILNRPEIIEIVRKYTTKTDLFYVV